MLHKQKKGGKCARGGHAPEDKNATSSRGGDKKGRGVRQSTKGGRKLACVQRQCEIGGADKNMCIHFSCVRCVPCTRRNKQKATPSGQKYEYRAVVCFGAIETRGDEEGGCKWAPSQTGQGSLEGARRRRRRRRLPPESQARENTVLPVRQGGVKAGQGGFHSSISGVPSSPPSPSASPPAPSKSASSSAAPMSASMRSM